MFICPLQAPEYVVQLPDWRQVDSAPRSSPFPSQSRKWSRARVAIGGQCVFLQISLRIKIFDFFLKSKLLYESHLTSHTLNP